jgi:mono/diheme cytochrome c family protein
MANNANRRLMIAISTIWFNAAAWGQGFDVGKFEYLNWCAACHGADGKGSGPVSEVLKVAPANLTVLAKKNSGVFPLNSVFETIYGLK